MNTEKKELTQENKLDESMIEAPVTTGTTGPEKPKNILKSTYLSLKTKLGPYVKKFQNFLHFIIEKLIPGKAPKINFEEIKLENEEKKDYSLTRHYNEFQIFFGLILLVLGILLGFSNAEYFFVSFFGLVLIIIGFEIEEVYITNKRLIIRKIGLLERIIKIPQDEEHAIHHIVGFQVGRAPPQRIILGSGILAASSLIFTQQSTWIEFIVILTALTLVIIGMRINKRAITIAFAGNHFVILGARKGVPYHIFTSLVSMSNKISEESLAMKTETLDENVEDEEALK